MASSSDEDHDSRPERDAPVIGIDRPFYEEAARLESEGYLRICEGDWAWVYASPHTDRVVRITPYDPAYLFFTHLCMTSPHPNLPAVRAVYRLTGPGYAVEMNRYTPAEPSVSESFLAGLEVAGSGDPPGGELASLAAILARGEEAGRLLVPYFAGLDLNPGNVLMNGNTPILIDGYYQSGATIDALVSAGQSVDLSPDELAAFLTIPFYLRGRKQYGE
jgi:hypothetical protein